MLRFKTKLVAVIFSRPFLKRCHLVGKVCVYVCVREMCFICVFAGVYVSIRVGRLYRVRAFAPIRTEVRVRLIGGAGWAG